MVTYLKSYTQHHMPRGITLPPDLCTRTPPINQNNSIHLPRRDGRLSWPWWLVIYRDGLPVRSHPSR